MDVRIAEGIALLVVLLSMWEGARKGLILKVYSMVRLVLIIVVAIVLFPIIMKVLPDTFTLREGIGVLAALVVALIAVSLVANLLNVIDRIPVVKEVNRLGGAVLGTVMGIILVWILLVLLLGFSDVKEIQPVVRVVEQSKILTTIQNFNPITYFWSDFIIS